MVCLFWLIFLTTMTLVSLYFKIQNKAKVFSFSYCFSVFSLYLPFNPEQAVGGGGMERSKTRLVSNYFKRFHNFFVIKATGLERKGTAGALRYSKFQYNSKNLNKWNWIIFNSNFSSKLIWKITFFKIKFYYSRTLMVQYKVQIQILYHDLLEFFFFPGFL